MSDAVLSRGEASRQRILDTARTLLEEEGLERFILREIAKRADMGLGNLQYYFPARDDLLDACEREVAEPRFDIALRRHLSRDVHGARRTATSLARQIIQIEDRITLAQKAGQVAGEGVLLEP